ncbi:MAG: transcription antitermination factor NusB [Prevotella sp.]|nr:transcription antitermination factor NusB [Prevotella sp.]
MGQALSRSESREVAFRLIFAMGQQTVWDADAWNLALDGKTAPTPEQQYITKIVEKFTELRTEIDAKISAHLQKWTLDRLRQTDLAALRLAATEMALGTVPVPVIINEAVSLAKKYGEASSGAFVNGVLAQLAE